MDTEERVGVSSPTRHDQKTSRDFDSLILGGNRDGINPVRRERKEKAVSPASAQSCVYGIIPLLERYCAEFNRAADDEGLQIVCHSGADNLNDSFILTLTAANILASVSDSGDSLVICLRDDSGGPQIEIARLDQCTNPESFFFEGLENNVKQIAIPAKKIFALFLERAMESYSVLEQNGNEENIFVLDAVGVQPEIKKQVDAEMIAEHLPASRDLGSLLGGGFSFHEVEEKSVDTGLSSLFAKARSEAPEKIDLEMFVEDEVCGVNITRGEEMPEIRELSLTEACEMMRRAVSIELDSASRNGVKAFEMQDMKAVEFAMRRVTKVKQLQGRIYESLDDWQNELDSE